MKYFSIIIGLLFISITMQATRRALVIGIGDYPSTSGWSKINGDKDIPLVKEILIVNGFAENDITELKNINATYASICREFENMISKAQNGDYIYVHFSGHGQQVTDTNGDEEDGYDEAWIPYDAQLSYEKGKYEGENHILDDQLNQYFHHLREKVGIKGKIVIIADACHSGGASRNEKECIIRGTSDSFIIPTEARKKLDIPSYDIEWTFISACKPYQSNYEYNGCGSLTYALYLQRNDFSKLSAKQVRQKVSACIADLIRFTQTPVLEITKGKETEIFL